MRKMSDNAAECIGKELCITARQFSPRLELDPKRSTTTALSLMHLALMCEVAIHLAAQESPGIVAPSSSCRDLSVSSVAADFAGELVVLLKKPLRLCCPLAFGGSASVFCFFKAICLCRALNRGGFGSLSSVIGWHCAKHRLYASSLVKFRQALGRKSRNVLHPPLLLAHLVLKHPNRTHYINQLGFFAVALDIVQEVDKNRTMI
ncbi:hypothetical protein KC366_g64 [Hortaea werneckii]|nr:hypothetical protein KC366_g64 [Hortaea werneckii]